MSVRTSYEGSRTNPIAEFVSQYIINLPTHKRIDEDFVNEVYDFLKRSRNAM